MTKVLAALEDSRWMHRDDMRRLMIDICGSKEKAQNLHREMVKQEFIAPVTAITERARQAMKELP